MSKVKDIPQGDSFPIKVQVSLNDGSNTTLIYGKDKVPMVMTGGGMIPGSFGEMLLGDRIKGYFNAHITADGQLCVDCDIPDQKW